MKFKNVVAIAVSHGRNKPQNQQAFMSQRFAISISFSKMLLSRYQHARRLPPRLLYSTVSSTDAAKIVTDKVFEDANAAAGKLQ